MKIVTILPSTLVIVASVLLCLGGALTPIAAQLNGEISLDSKISLNEEGISLAVSPDGYTIAVAMRGNKIGLWDVRTGQRVATLQADIDAAAENVQDHVPSAIEFSPDGGTLACLANRNQLFDSNRLHLWDARTGRHIATTATSGFFDLSFSPDGQTIVTGNSGWNSNAPATDILYFWDARTLEPIRTLTHPVWSAHYVIFSPDGRMIVTVETQGGNINVWDARTLQLMGTLEQKIQHPQTLAFLSDGRTLVVSHITEGVTKIDFWDISTRQHITTLQSGYTQFAVSPVGDILAAPAGQGAIDFWDISTHQRITTFRSPAFLFARSVAFSQDGQALVALVAETSARQAIYLWRVPIHASQPDSPADTLTPDRTPDVGTIQPSEPNSQQRQSHRVRMVYFRPTDRSAQRGVTSRLTTLIKDVQHFYAAQMHRHERKTFNFETDAEGNAIVHRIDGKFTDAYYQQYTFERVQEEIEAAFDIDQHVYLVAIDVSSEMVTSGAHGSVCGIGGGSWQSRHGSDAWKRSAGGLAVIPASGNCFTVGVTAHELGHAFGLEHDFRKETYLMGYGSQTELSKDAAEWFSVHRYFNTGQTVFDQETTLTAVSARAANLKFQLTDADGLYQVQLLIPATASDPVSGTKLHSSQMLNGRTSGTVTFAVPELTGDSEVTLQVIDNNGNIIKQTFPVETDSLTEVPEVPGDGNVARVSLSPASTWSGNIGDQLTVNADIADGIDVRGYQVELTFNTTALRFISSADGGYLPAGAFQVPPVMNGNKVTFGATSLQASSEGDGTLAAFTFEVLTASPALPTLSDVKLTDSNADFLAVRIENPDVRDRTPLAGDVNGDGVVDLTDMTAAAARLGRTGENTADMNGDGVIDAADLLLIAVEIEAAAAAPSLHASAVIEMFTATEVRQWLEFARTQGLTGSRYQRGFLLLEQLLRILTPTETALLANYPNPFNPETWIPYQLSEPADVRISIYAADGRLVRVLTLGHRGAGIYESRGHAAYWDGKNQLGEPVASGVYFYTFTADEFTATRKMLIRK